MGVINLSGLPYCVAILSSLLVCLVQEAGLFLKEISNVLQETLFVMEYIVLVLDKSDTKHMEHSLWTR